MAEFERRLMTYAVAAAVVPAGAASAAVVWSGPGQVGIASPGSPLLVDFGPGIGEIFRFNLTAFTGQQTAFGSRSYFNAWVNFNPGNGNGVVAPMVRAAFVDGDPFRLSTGDPINAAQSFNPMTQAFGTANDLAFTSHIHGSTGSGGTFTGGNAYGFWNGGARGFMGFNVEVNGADTFGWVDIEYLPGGFTRDGGVPLLIIHGWAYNDTPRGPINAGEIPAPASVGLAALAMGAAGIRRHRRMA